MDPVFEFLELLLCCDVALSSPIGIGHGFHIHVLKGKLRQKLIFHQVHQSPGQRACRAQLTSLFDLFGVQSCHSN